MALDACEPAIIRALEKDGWTIHEKPFILRGDDRSRLADFSVQRVADGMLEEIVVVEVKCFANPRRMAQEFYLAVGQYEYYRASLVTENYSFPLYLAMPVEAYTQLAQSRVVDELVRRAEINLLVVDTEVEVVSTWINWNKP
ncbi:MAG: hypothetical protein KF726_24665 [Anaerolineae bacterium]|nr:hypothetical protein [Anaerolineae bacterium]